MKVCFFISLQLLFGCQSAKTDFGHENMALIESGQLKFGSAEGKEHEKPVVNLIVKSFYLDKNEVTNADFKKFVNKTGYATDAEKLGSSMIFIDQWDIVEGASWHNKPYGEKTLPPNFDSLPVVHVSWNDAKSYCEWKKKRLPTEHELEFILEKNNVQQLNVWEGEYPNKNTLKDGFYWTAPVRSYPPNKLGVYDLEGNVWEWTADNYHHNSHDILALNNEDSSGVWKKACYDPSSENPTDLKKVIKGGSFLCHDSYCCGYKPEARMPAEPRSSYFHIGFRCACDL